MGCSRANRENQPRPGPTFTFATEPLEDARRRIGIARRNEEAPLPNCWVHSLDDLRREPARLVYGFNLQELGVTEDEDDLKLLPPPLPLPRAKFLRNKAWEARAILAHLGLPAPEPPEPTQPRKPRRARAEHSAVWKPGQPLPRNADRKTLAAIITHESGPVTHRALEDWPLVGRRFGSRKVFNVKAALEIARQRFEAATERKGGRVRDRERTASRP